MGKRLTLDTTNMPWYKVRELILLRDKKTCVECNRNLKYKRAIHVHHIDGDHANNDPSNLENVIHTDNKTFNMISICSICKRITIHKI